MYYSHIRSNAFNDQTAEWADALLGLSVSLLACLCTARVRSRKLKDKFVYEMLVFKKQNLESCPRLKACLENIFFIWIGE